MKKFVGLSYDVSDLVSEGQIDYLVNLTKDDPDELTKTAHIPSKEEIDEMPNEDFALVLYHSHAGFLKKFATHDKYVTKINMKILEKNHQKYPDEISKTAAHYLQKAAQHFKLSFPEDLKKLAEGKHVTNIVDLDAINQVSWAKKESKLTKAAEIKEFALPQKNKYPIGTPDMVTRAVEYFEKNAHRFSPIDAIEYAFRTKKAAVKHNVTVDGTNIEKYASRTGSYFNKDYRAHIRSRKGFVSEDDASVYDELVKGARNYGVVKTAEYLEKVDRQFSIHPLWGSNLEDPYMAVLGMRKEAECLHKGKKIRKSMLKKAAENVVDEETLKELQGPDGIAIFESLPTPLKDKIVKNL